MSTITPPYDPTSYLGVPTGHGSGSAIWQTRMACGPVIGGVDAFIDAISGFSPLEEWVMKPFAGDWDAFDRGTQAWEQVGNAVDAVAHNLAALPGMVADDDWAGDARTAWATANTKIAQMIGPLPQACDAMAQYCQALGELARAIIEYVLEMLKWAAETALLILAEQAVPVVGQVAGAATVTVFGVRLVIASRRIVEFITKFKKLVEMISKVLSIINGAVSNFAQITAALAAADTASRHALAASPATP